MTERRPIGELMANRQLARQEGFEESTLKALLKVLGWPVKKIRGTAASLEAGFTWDWFTDEGLLSTVEVGSTLIPQFNLDALLIRPEKHEIPAAWAAWRKEHQALEFGALVFRVYNLGRMVVTDMPPLSMDEQGVSISIITSTVRCRVVPFDQFFSPFAQEYEDVESDD